MSATSVTAFRGRVTQRRTQLAAGKMETSSVSQKGLLPDALTGTEPIVRRPAPIQPCWPSLSNRCSPPCRS